MIHKEFVRNWILFISKESFISFLITLWLIVLINIHRVPWLYIYVALTIFCLHFLCKLYHWKWQVTISFRFAWLCDNVTCRCKLSQQTFQKQIRKNNSPASYQTAKLQFYWQRCIFSSIRLLIKTFRENFFAFLYVFCCNILWMVKLTPNWLNTLKVKLTPKVTSFYIAQKYTIVHKFLSEKYYLL